MPSRPALLGTPLGQFGLGAVALVLGGALLFSLIGAVADTEDDGGDTPQAGATDSFSPEDASPTPSSTATDAPSASAPATEGTDAPTDTATDGTAAPTESATPTETTPAIDPASITIQVLGGADLAVDEDAVISCLESAGYSNLITGNRARTTYETTTVFYTAGGEDAAQQVASTLGVGGSQEQPGNLSEDVPVHVVAGNDGSDLC